MATRPRVTPRAWRILCLASFAALVGIGIIGSVLEQWMTAPSQPVIWLAAGVYGVIFFCFLISIPPVAVSWFIAAQERIGNAGHPLVAGRWSSTARTSRRPRRLDTVGRRGPDCDPRRHARLDDRALKAWLKAPNCRSPAQGSLLERKAGAGPALMVGESYEMNFTSVTFSLPVAASRSNITSVLVSLLLLFS